MQHSNSLTDSYCTGDGMNFTMNQASANPLGALSWSMSMPMPMMSVDASTDTSAYMDMNVGDADLGLGLLHDEFRSEGEQDAVPWDSLMDVGEGFEWVCFLVFDSSRFRLWKNECVDIEMMERRGVEIEESWDRRGEERNNSVMDMHGYMATNNKIEHLRYTYPSRYQFGESIFNAAKWLESTKYEWECGGL